MTDDFDAPSLWVPMSSKIDLAILGKLGEEANELGNICCRAIIQGIDGRDPETQRTNRESLWREIADVRALCQLAEDNFSLPGNAMQERLIGKLRMKRGWLRLLLEAGYK